MKHFPSLSLVSGLAVFAVAVSGCGNGDTQQSYEHTQEEQPVASASQAQEQNIWERIGDYSHNKAAEFRQAVSSAADTLQEQAQTAGSQLGDASETAGEDLREAKDAFQESLDELGDATAETWEAAKERVRESFQRLRAAYEDRAS